MNTQILGQEEAIEICARALTHPTHLFFYGAHGMGKTSLAVDFLDSYALLHDITPRDPKYFLFLTADVDRGIHTIRAKLADFTRGAQNRPGVLRWVFLDDADSLPEVSQQALRRPMEQYNHLTCFIFATKSSECLIPALQSRCQPVRIYPVNLQNHMQTILDRMKYTITDEQVLHWLISTSLSSIAELQSKIQLLQWIAPENPTYEEARQICATHDYEKIIHLVRAICSHDVNEIYTQMSNLWQNGMSFEDILHAVHNTSDLYFVLDSKSQEHLYTFLVTGWAYHAQSRCSFLDLLCCLMDSGLLTPKPLSVAL